MGDGVIISAAKNVWIIIAINYDVPYDLSRCVASQRVRRVVERANPPDERWCSAKQEILGHLSQSIPGRLPDILLTTDSSDNVKSISP